jgi:rhamnosyltransferase
LKNTDSSNGVRPVIAVIAAFNPDEDFGKRVEVLQSYVDEVIVVNDGSGESYDGIFDTVSALGASVLHSAKNSGIAAALNSGVRRARQLAGPHFILTMDQDSSLDLDYVRKAVATYDAAWSAGVNVGLVSAQSFNSVPALKDGSAAGRFGVPFDPWQSGMLIPSTVFDSGISFNEEYFIDNVDSEFSLNLRTKDYMPIMGEGCNLLHNLGEKKVGRVLGREIAYTYHSPKRIYYITRNSFFLAQDYLVRCPRWFVRKTFHDILNQSIRFILSEQKRSVARMVAAGVRDGLMRRPGRFEDKYPV